VIWPFNLHQNVNNLLITSACFMNNIKTGYSNPTTQTKHKDSCVLKVHWLITTRSINHLDQRKVCLYLCILSKSTQTHHWLTSNFQPITFLPDIDTLTSVTLYFTVKQPLFFLGHSVWTPFCRTTSHGCFWSLQTLFWAEKSEV